MTPSSEHSSGKRLSVAMIVRDAEDLLPDTLGSLQSIADEIVVLDTGSRDATVDVAREHGARVVQSAWSDDFARARNLCATHAEGEWILWMDAGETIDELSAERLRQFVDERAQESKSYLLYVCKPAVGTSVAGEQIGQLRLLPGQAHLTFNGRVRESVWEAIVAAGLDVDALNVQLHRHIRTCDEAIRRAKAERNLRLVDLSLAEGSQKAVLQNARAEALAELGKVDEAVEAYRQGIAKATHGSTEMLEAYYGLLTAYDERPEERDVQMAICLEALDVYPLDSQLLCGMGCYLLHQQRLDLAARSYQLAATHGQIDPATWHLADVADMATACLALTEQLLGNTAEAETTLKAALATRPTSVRLRRQLIELYAKLGRSSEALGHVEKLPGDREEVEALRAAVRGAVLLRQGQQQGLAELESAYRAGCRDSLCLRWLALAHIEAGSLDSARSVLEVWQQLEPTNLEIAGLRQALKKGAERRSPPSGPHRTPAVHYGDDPISPQEWARS